MVFRWEAGLVRYKSLVDEHGAKSTGYHKAISLQLNLTSCTVCDSYLQAIDFAASTFTQDQML